MRKWASQVASAVKNLPANRADVGDGFGPWVRKVPWRRKWQPTPIPHSFLENPMDRGAWWATVQGVAMNQTQLRDWSRAQVGQWLQPLQEAITCPGETDDDGRRVLSLATQKTWWQPWVVSRYQPKKPGSVGACLGFSSLAFCAKCGTKKRRMKGPGED